MHKIKKLVILLAIAFTFVYCGQTAYNTRGLEQYDQFQFAKKLFNDGEYKESQIVFDRIARLNIVSEWSDSAQYLLGEAYFKDKSYILAQSEFDRLVRGLPGSLLVKDAYFKIAQCYFMLSPKSSLDQDYSLKAIQAYDRFLAQYPFDTTYKEIINDNKDKLTDKLAKKEFEIAHLYYKMGDYGAAIVYYDFILTNPEYYNSSYAKKALYEKALSQKKLKKFKEAQESLQIFLEQFTEEDSLREKVRQNMTEIKIAIAKIDTVRTPY
jgi:outer membrane protein assembly factor BamD